MSARSENTYISIEIEKFQFCTTKTKKNYNFWGPKKKKNRNNIFPFFISGLHYVLRLLIQQLLNHWAPMVLELIQPDTEVVLAITCIQL